MEYFYLAYEKENDRIYGSYEPYLNDKTRDYEYINEHLSIVPDLYEEEGGVLTNYIEMYKNAVQKIKNMNSFEDAIVLKNEKIAGRQELIFKLPGIYMEFRLLRFGPKIPTILDGTIYGSFIDEESTNEHGKIFQFLEREEIENIYEHLTRKS